MEQKRKLNNQEIVALIAAAAVLLSLWLPWVEVNAFGFGGAVSAYQMLTSNNNARGGPSVGLLWLIPLAMLAAIGATLAGRNRQPGESGHFLLVLLAGLASLGALAYLHFEFQGAMNRQSSNPFEQALSALARAAVQINYLVGAYLAGLGSITVALSGLAGLLAAKRATPDAGQQTQPPDARAALPFASPPNIIGAPPAPTSVKPATPAPLFAPPSAAPTPPLPAQPFPFAPATSGPLGQADRAARTCPKCATRVKMDFRFCTTCGEDLLSASSAAVPVAQAPPAPSLSGSGMQPTLVMSALKRDSGAVAAHFPSGGLPSNAPLFEQRTAGLPANQNRKTYLSAVIAVVTVIALAAAGYFIFFSAKRAILAEIKKGNFVKPEGSSAYDLYFKNVTRLSSSARSEIEREAAAELERRGNEILNRLKQEAVDSEAEMFEATRLYRWLHDLRPNNSTQSRQYFAQARLAFLKGDNQQALSDYRRAIELDSSWALPFNGLARAHVKLNDRANARGAYQRATQIEPDWLYPWLNLGQLCLGSNDLACAQNSLQRALVIDSRKATAHFFLAQTNEKLGNGCGAYNEYRVALECAAGNPTPGFNVDNVRKTMERLTSQYFCIF